MNQSKRIRRGATAVEFSIVAPILFLFIFASIEFSRMNMIRHTADNAAYEAARRALVPGGTSAEAIEFSENMLATQRIQNATITITPNPILETTERITVDVSVPMDDNAWFSRFSKEKVILANCSLMTERVPVIQASTLVLPPPPPTTTPPPTIPPPDDGGGTTTSPPPDDGGGTTSPPPDDDPPPPPPPPPL